jgi:DNA-directed RNA polymerase subunit RPC12/RpoP
MSLNLYTCPKCGDNVYPDYLRPINTADVYACVSCGWRGIPMTVETEVETYPDIHGKIVKVTPIIDLNREELLACYLALQNEKPYSWRDSAMEKINTYLIKTAKGERDDHPLS